MQPSGQIQLPATQTRVGRWEYWVALILPLTSLVKSESGGTIYGQDLVGFLLLAFLIAQKGALTRLKVARPFFVMIGIWLAAQVVTDVIRESPAQDYLRGWGKILFFAIQFAVLWLFLTRKWTLIILYTVGAAIATILAVRDLPPPYNAFPWKFGIAQGCVMLAAVAGSWLTVRGKRMSTWIPAGLIGAMALLALVNGARSIFGLSMLAALYIAFVGMVRQRPAIAQGMNPAKFLLLIAAGFVAAQGIVSAYGMAAESGVLGEDQRAKFEAQTGGDVSLIQSGRSESLVSIEAIKDSPIIGHGSWAKDMKYVRMLAHRLVQSGLKKSADSEGRFDLIPTHSHLLGAWVEAGILGATFWMWACVVAFMALYSVLKSHRTASPIIVLACFFLIWDVLFSPFGAVGRFQKASQLVIILYALEALRASQRRLIVRVQGTPRAVFARRLPQQPQPVPN